MSANFTLISSSSILIPLDDGVIPVLGSGLGGVPALAIRLDAVAKREVAEFKPPRDVAIASTK